METSAKEWVHESIKVFNLQISEIIVEGKVLRKWEELLRTTDIVITL